MRTYTEVAERIDRRIAQIDREMAATLDRLSVANARHVLSVGREMARLEGEQELLKNTRATLQWAVEGRRITLSQALLTIMDALSRPLPDRVPTEYQEGRRNAVAKLNLWFAPMIEAETADPGARVATDL